MLRIIPKNISPDLMKILLQMGHGDEIVFADANFPAESMGKRVIRADGDTIISLLQSVMPFFPLDNFVDENVKLMAPVVGKGDSPAVWVQYKDIINKYDREESFRDFTYLERYDFYEHAKNTFAIVATGEKEKYANIILKLGVIE